MNNTYELVKLDTNALAVISTIVAQRRGIGSATICAASRKDLPGDAMPCAAHDPQTVISTQSLVCANVCQRAGPPRDNRLSRFYERPSIQDGILMRAKAARSES